MALKIFNTLGHDLEEFKPSDKNKVKLYTCGPTVYNHVHIGNLRAYITPDILKRALEFNGYDVDWVMNITDVDDKTIANTIKKYGQNAGVAELQKFTDEYFQIFLEDLKKININPEGIRFVKVTEKIADIQLYILELLKKGYAYTADDDSTYFNIEKYQKDFGNYGELVGEKFLEGKKVGARVKVDEYDKENLSDFALWKAHGPDDGQIFWDHPTLGKGRPGWHIECTLINYYAFEQKTTDIHSGGIDLLFPHHTNEIAQAEPIYGKGKFVNYWLHSEHILVDNKKMSKSLGNFFTLSDLEKEGIADGLDLRFLMLQSHYRSRLNITKESLAAAKNGLRNLKKSIASIDQNIKETGKNYTEGDVLLKEFSEALNSDLNTPEAMSILYKSIGNSRPKEEKNLIFKFDEVLGLNLDQKATDSVSDSINISEDIKIEVKNLIAERDTARKNKDYKLSDQLRKKLETSGYEVLDTPEGTKLKKLT